MAEITASEVKALRDRTGAGMMDCKKALVACEGDIEKAIDPAAGDDDVVISIPSTRQVTSDFGRKIDMLDK